MSANASDKLSLTEKQLSESTNVVEQGDAKLARKLKSRHVVLMAIGSCLGTGLLLNSGSSLNTAGPVGMILGYLTMSLVSYNMATSLAEMSSYLPIDGHFVEFAIRFVDESLGFALGWTYTFSFLIIFPTEIIAMVLLIGYWDVDGIVPEWAWIIIFMVCLFLTNLVDVEKFGEIEFWLSIIKLIMAIGVILVCLIVTCGGNTDHKAIGFRYWRNPGPFNNYLTDKPVGKFLGYWSVMITAGFGYQGIEMVALTVAELPNASKILPSVMKKVLVWILGTNVGSVFFFSLVLSSKDESLLSALTEDAQTGAKSPFVLACKHIAHGNALPSIVNAVILLACFSAANTMVYIPTRTLYALAKRDMAPKFLSWTSKKGIPYPSITICALFGLLSLMTLDSTAEEVFNWLVNLTTVFGFIAWLIFMISYIRFYHALKHNKISRYDKSIFHYKSRFQPYLTYFCTFLLTIIIITQGFYAFMPWSTSNFFVCYASVFIFIILFIGWKIFKRTSIVPISEIDLTTGRLEALDNEYEELEEPKVWEKVLNIFF